MNRRGHLMVLAGAMLAFGGAVVLQVVRDAAYARHDRQIEQVLYIPSGSALQRMVLEFDALAADVYWIRAIQHFGGDRLAPDRQRRYELLYPLLDITTTLDPYFTIAYRFGAIFLSEPSPGGPGRPDQAIALLRKGLAAQPGRWQYYHDIAFVHYWHLKDFTAAAAWFQRAAGQPGAPNWLPSVAASMLIEGGDRASARFLWEQIRGSDHQWLQQSAERRLLQLDALDLIDAIETRIRQVSLPAGEAYTWGTLVRRRILPGMPLDPTGTPFELDPATGRVTVSSQSTLHPMPETAQRSAS